MPKWTMMVLLVLMLLTTSAHAIEDQVEQRRLVDTLIELTGVKVVSRDIAKQLTERILKKLELRGIEPESVREFVEQEVSLEVDYQLIENNAIVDISLPLYTAHFSVIELRRLVAFYRSPLGMKSMQLMPIQYDKLLDLLVVDSQTRFQDLENTLVEQLKDQQLITTP